LDCILIWQNHRQKKWYVYRCKIWSNSRVYCDGKYRQLLRHQNWNWVSQQIGTFYSIMGIALGLNLITLLIPHTWVFCLHIITGSIVGAILGAIATKWKKIVYSILIRRRQLALEQGLQYG
jgi:hypothetical protein